MALEILELSVQPLTLDKIAHVASGTLEVEIAPSAFGQMRASREVVEGLLHRQETAYGINTGFGKLADLRIPAQDVVALAAESCPEPRLRVRRASFGT
jgi:histidine ammonia-lyase